MAKATFGLREWLTPGSGILHVRASMDDEEIELKGEEDQPQRSLNPVYENRLLLSSYASGLLPCLHLYLRLCLDHYYLLTWTEPCHRWPTGFASSFLLPRLMLRYTISTIEFSNRLI